MAEAKQSVLMLSFEGLARRGGRMGMCDNSMHLITPLPRIREN